MGTINQTEQQDEPSRSPIPWLAAAALLFAATVAARWPGIVMHDSVEQYGQALAGRYDDWHPPIMARTWALLNHIQPGTGPFFLIQILLWWGGLGLLAAAFGRQARHKAAGLVLLVGVAPLFLGWATVVLKDAQMACCLVAATGVAAHWRLVDRVPPAWAKATILLLIAYATLVRANAVFATVPFALALFVWGGVRRTPLRISLLLLATGIVVALSGPVNYRLLGAERSKVERTLFFYDLAGIAHFAPLATLPGLAPGQWAEAERRECYTPSLWDPYGDRALCGFIGDALEAHDNEHDDVMRIWAGAILHHPIAYAQHRIAHLNSNLRFWVGPGQWDAAPPIYSENNRLGLGGPPVAAGQELVEASRTMAASPLGWPFAWFGLSLGLLWASARVEGGGQVALGRALALSTVCMSASFAVISIASDLRYHLWSMIAAALAWILLADARALDRRRAMIAGSVLLALTVIAAVGHIGLASQVYRPQAGATGPITRLR
ncbi:hypothetical protein [Sphingomonas sp. MMS24-J13]|uniref:hypothetical protein n=1 Tax=Sphingomonas sp. MMS24-J13 TaxID=3238686 RepID=UPI00384F49D8